MYLLRVCSLIILFLAVSFAKNFTFEELNEAPKGLVKDYYIYKFVNNNEVSKDDLSHLQKQIYRYKGKIKTKFDKELDLKKTDPCKGEFLSLSLKCQKIKISSKIVANLSKRDRNLLLKKYKKQDKDLYEFMMILNSKNPIKKAIKEQNTFAYRKLFLESKNKNEFFANKIGEEFINKLAGFYWFRAYSKNATILRNNENLRKQLLEISPKSSNVHFAFTLGLNSILLNDEKRALKYFEFASSSEKNVELRDKALFWVYLVSKNRTPLKKLASSKDISIYSLYAMEKTGGRKISIVSPKISNDKKINDYDISDPFAWQKSKEEARKLSKDELKKYANKFRTSETLGQYCYFLERINGWERHYFPMPFMDYIGTNDKERQALILSIARQESRFIPTAISSSYALGMMQFMPFLANHIGKKELKIEGFEQDDMFEPKTAYKIANVHLDYLEKYLQSPLFIAYAYNGGIGFVRRMLKNGKYFSHNSKYEKYEPFLSIETVPYEQSREYGKKVLANYIIYLSILDSSKEISHFFENLEKPGALEKFRLL